MLDCSAEAGKEASVAAVIVAVVIASAAAGSVAFVAAVTVVVAERIAVVAAAQAAGTDPVRALDMLAGEAMHQAGWVASAVEKWGERTME